MDALGARLYGALFGAPKVADQATIRALLADAAPGSSRFVESEWEHIVDAWQLRTWEAYRDVSRLGRRTRLPEAARQRLWPGFAAVFEMIEARGSVTPSQIFTRLAEHFNAGHPPAFEFAVVDEAQDVSVAQLKFLAAMGGNRPDSLFFAGDLGQRIFQQPFSWRSLGVNIRGRSATLRINYRTSHQIRRQADRLLGPEVSDVDGNKETRKTISVFEGAAPEIAVCADQAAETAHVAAWLRAQHTAGVAPAEAPASEFLDDLRGEHATRAGRL